MHHMAQSDTKIHDFTASAQGLGTLKALDQGEHVWPGLIGIATEPGIKTVSDLIHRLDEKTIEHLLDYTTNSEHFAGRPDLCADMSK